MVILTIGFVAVAAVGGWGVLAAYEAVSRLRREDTSRVVRVDFAGHSVLALVRG